ncbi:tyrosine-type recombinase/integrase [Myxococcus eversor]|uniref:tyrosine-type recombinase/integrase n=1 Tax=Myxococcus eversor TaxID=2709661 RepID=UPI0013D1E3D5|nr:site-specific integrase [Myxococcus eversor]
MAYVRKKAGRKGFTATIKSASGEFREVAVPGRTKTEARKNARDLETKAWRVRHNLEVEPGLLLLVTASADYLKAIRHHEGWKSTESRWRLHILPGLGRKAVAQILPTDIEAFLATKQDEGYSQQSRRHLRMTLSAFYRWAIKAELAIRNPVSETETIAVPVATPAALKFEQVEVLRDAAGVQWLADLIWVAAHLGLRYAELRQVEWTHIDWRNRRIATKRAKRIAGRERRTPPRPASIPESLIPYLREMHKRRRGNFLFCYEDGGQLPTSSPDARFKSALKAAGIVSGYRRICRRQTCRYEEKSKVGRSVECPKCGFLLWVSPIHGGYSFKSLRSTLITHIIDTTGNPRAAQLQADQADIRTTLNHYHAADLDVQGAAIDKAFAGSGTNTPPRAMAAAGRPRSPE